jgi:hypothetical protein
MASLVCLVLLPVIFCECPLLGPLQSGDYLLALLRSAGPDCLDCFNSAVQGKPSKAIVDSLAVFGVSVDCAAVRRFRKIELANGYLSAIYSNLWFSLANPESYLDKYITISPVSLVNAA